MYKRTNDATHFLARTGNYGDRLSRDLSRPRPDGSDLYAAIASCDTMDAMELQRRRILNEMKDVDESLRSITSQIRVVQSKRREQGTYADDDWWIRANDARRHYARRRQALQEALGTINKRMRDWNRENLTLTWERAFINEARKLLPQTDYERCSRVADETKGQVHVRSKGKI